MDDVALLGADLQGKDLKEELDLGLILLGEVVPPTASAQKNESFKGSNRRRTAPLTASCYTETTSGMTASFSPILATESVKYRYKEIRDGTLIIQSQGGKDAKIIIL